MELDRQGIERRDFPIARRGYDPASVDAHLRALAADVEELQREASSRGRESLASTAGTQVQGILEAAQATAETIEREAAQDAQRARESANTDAKRTREEAVARAQEHVAAVSKATEALLTRVGSLDTETQTLLESLRSGANQLAGDLAAVETNMGSLYDAAAGRAGGGEAVERNATPNGSADAPIADLTIERGAPQAASNTESQPEPQAREPVLIGEPLPVLDAESKPSPLPGDRDGARLVALNMALNGDSREETGRYLAENFDVPDRERLLDEVYAAIEG
ncbi:MAG: DivIVA domain-containing protein [Solirubrobacteraceae bacterium]